MKNTLVILIWFTVIVALSGAITKVFFHEYEQLGNTFLIVSVVLSLFTTVVFLVYLSRKKDRKR